MKTPVRVLPAAIALACAAGFAASALAADQSADGLAMQAARAKVLQAEGKGKKPYYTTKFDLSGLPAYAPKEKVTGTIRMWGSNYPADGLLAGYWEEGFKKFHPDVKFEFVLKAPGVALPALTTGVADVAPTRRITFPELLAYQRMTDADPLEITYATGSYDVSGWSPAYGIVVSAQNPLTKITIEQLDGVFGAPRLGGWEGTSWRPEYGRGADKNIRTWGQLGLTGEWADKPINTYGLNQRYHQAIEMSDRLLKGSDKWNENMRIYANYVDKNGNLARSLSEDLQQDKYGMAWIAAPTKAEGAFFSTSSSNAPADKPKKLKTLALAETSAGPYYEYTMENLRNRVYPLYDAVYFYANAIPGKGMDPKVREFLRYVLSREGQNDVMRDGKYLPLTEKISKEELAKLDAADKAKAKAK